MIKSTTLAFLQDLKQHNNRAWFAANKADYEKAHSTAKANFEAIYKELQKTDSIEKMNVFRIYRDVRFSKNKLPYKTNFGVSYSRTKPLLRGGYYLHLEPGNSFVGGGFWAPNKEDLLRIRKEIELDAEELRAIINAKVFKKTFGKLVGDEVKTAPRGFSKTHPAIDLIKKKQFLVIRNLSDTEVLSSQFQVEVLETFKAMRPFFDYMSAVLTTNLNGESLYELH